MPTLSGPLIVGHNIPSLGSLYDQNHTIEGNESLSIEIQEASFNPITAEAHTQGSKVRDHLLLTV